MTGTVVLAASVVAGLAAVGIAAWYAADRAEQKARAALDTTTWVCVTCRVTPVPAANPECAACRHRATYHICPVCKTQRVPMPNAPCGICVHAFAEELNQWGATP